MRLLIGIDDTDIISSRGTGFHSRVMGRLLEEKKIGHITGITRHQLLLDPRIPYTSHNSSACIEIEASGMGKLIDTCREFLIETGPEGCDTGLCVVPFKEVSNEIVAWGLLAKKEVLEKESCIRLAEKENIHLEGLAGTHDGIIGALAAIGLRKSGNDGRFLWLKGQQELRDLGSGIYTTEHLMEVHNFDSIENREGRKIKGDSSVYLSDWTRPVLRNGKAVLIVEPAGKESGYEWVSASKDYIKSVS